MRTTYTERPLLSVRDSLSSSWTLTAVSATATTNLEIGTAAHNILSDDPINITFYNDDNEWKFRLLGNGY